MAGNTYVINKDANPGGQLTEAEALLTVDESTNTITVTSKKTTGSPLSIQLNPATFNPSILDGTSSALPTQVGTLIFYIDEAGSQLTVSVMYRNGVTTRVGNIPLS